MARCEAKSKRSGKQCKRAAAMGRTTCAMHGGKTPIGIASPHFKTGRYSKDLAAAPAILERFQAEREMGDASQLVDEIALLRTRAGQLLQNLEHHESGGLWKAAVEACDELADAVAREEEDDIAAALHNLRGILESGAKPYAIWREISGYCAMIGKLARVELQRETRQQETMNAREAAVFKSVIETNLRDALQHNCDPELQRRILTDFVSGVRRDLAGHPPALSRGSS